MGSTTAASDPPDATEPRFVVIVHEANTTSSLGRKFVADAFLKKTTRWGNDVAILPVDLKPRSTVRGAFSHGVLKRSVAAVRNYWRQIVFSGRGVPPPELHADQRVVRYVREHRGAIGYVSPAVDLTGVKIVRVR
jgi:ABC-type phosphate transport system substrate-binding protein